MLHVQLAANLCSGLGQKPTFTSAALQNSDYGWACYGPEKTVIPHIIDLTDTTTYHNVKVNIEALNRKRSPGKR